MTYDIRFKPTGNGWEGKYCKKIINAPATCVVLTRRSGLRPMTKCDIEIRAQSFDQEGKWTKHSKYISKFVVCIANCSVCACVKWVYAISSVHLSVCQ